VSDAKWFEVDADIEAAINHFQKSITLHQKGGFDAPGIDGYQSRNGADACATVGSHLTGIWLASDFGNSGR